jgi:hypothetical protein
MHLRFFMRRRNVESRSLLNVNNVSDQFGIFCAGWIVPSVWNNGGIAGPTTALRILLIIPMFVLGARLARRFKHSIPLAEPTK